MVGPEIRVDLGEEKEDFLEEVNFKENSLTAECPEKDKGSSQKPTEGKKFEDYTYAYGGAEEPQLATASALPQAYEDALATMRQSLKNRDPLHGLDM